MSRSLSAAVLALTLASPALGQAIGRGFELERAGRHADAANVYLGTVRADPANLPALLGLERVLPALGRLPELVPLVQRARARAPESGALRGLELRVWAGLSEPDSLEAAARRWALATPGSDAPYREWALALADHRAVDEARRVLLAGRRALGGEATLAIELAELEQRTGNWEAAGREWGRAVAVAADLLPNASSQLAETPAAQRERVVRALTGDGTAVPPRTRRLAAELLLIWGRPLEGWALFVPTLGTPPPPHPPPSKRRRRCGVTPTSRARWARRAGTACAASRSAAGRTSCRRRSRSGRGPRRCASCSRAATAPGRAWRWSGWPAIPWRRPTPRRWPRRRCSRSWSRTDNSTPLSGGWPPASAP